MSVEGTSTGPVLNEVLTMGCSPRSSLLLTVMISGTVKLNVTLHSSLCFIFIYGNGFSFVTRKKVRRVLEMNLEGVSPRPWAHLSSEPLSEDR